jgi:hypothetical protein
MVKGALQNFCTPYRVPPLILVSPFSIKIVLGLSYTLRSAVCDNWLEMCKVHTWQKFLAIYSCNKLCCEVCVT